MNGSIDKKSTLKIPGNNLSKDWVSPEALERKWKKAELKRTLLLLFLSHILTFLLFYQRPPRNSLNETASRPKNGFVLVKLLALSTVQAQSKSKILVSLYAKRGRFIGHAYLRNPPKVSPKPQLVSLEVSINLVVMAYQASQEGLSILPHTHQPKKTSTRRIYEMDI